MKLVEEDYREAVKAHKDEVLDCLREMTPRQVVELLEDHGWPRKWACKIVDGIEKKYNPANLELEYNENQILREKYRKRVTLGGSALLIGLVVVIESLFVGAAFRELVILAYGSVLCGAAILWSGLSNVGSYPDREIPVYKASEERK